MKQCCPNTQLGFELSSPIENKSDSICSFPLGNRHLSDVSNHSRLSLSSVERNILVYSFFNLVWKRYSLHSMRHLTFCCQNGFPLNYPWNAMLKAAITQAVEWQYYRSLKQFTSCFPLEAKPEYSEPVLCLYCLSSGL